MDFMFPGHQERKRCKKEKKAEKQAKFEKWEEGWKEKQREDDEKKAKKVRKQIAKEEAAKTSFEKNVPKYEIWGSKDQKGKVMIDRYQLHKSSEEKEKVKAERTLHASPAAPKASSVIRSKLPTHTPPTTRVYTPKVTRSHHEADEAASPATGASTSTRTHPGTEVPRPSNFSSATVELRYKNNVCYWPATMITLENLQERFGIKKPAMRLASVPKGPLAIKFKPQPDGTYHVQGGQSYVVFNLKDKNSARAPTSDEKVLTYEEKVLRFLTMEKFARGEVLPNSMGERQKMVREETFQFTPEGRFAFRVHKGYKDVEGSMREESLLVGKYKLKNKHKTLVLTFDKAKDKKNSRAQDRMAEKKDLYHKWFIPGDGTLQCYADQSIRFK